MGVLPAVLMIAMSAFATPPDESCHVLVSRHGPYLTLTGAVDPRVWAAGTYQMNISVTQGTNRSVSTQGGEFSAATDTDATEDGYRKLSISSVIAGDDADVSVTLVVRDVAQSKECRTTATP